MKPTMPTVLFSCVFLASSCLSAGDGGQEAGPVTKTLVQSGKADSSVDWCEQMGWYGDGICDTFCLFPDPDCGEVDAGMEDAVVEETAREEAGPETGNSWEIDYLADYTLAELNTLVKELETGRFNHGTTGMGWAHYSNNCFIRMRAVYYYANFGSLPQYDETEEGPQKELMKVIQQLDYSPVRELSFVVAGTLRLDGTFKADDPELQGKLNDSWEASWTNHTAALIGTDQGPMVVDLAFSREAQAVEEWQAHFLPAEMMGTCAFNDSEATAAINNYQIMKSLGQDPPLPDPSCAFELKEIFKKDDGTPFGDIDLFPYMWNDVHEMDVSFDFVQSNAGDAFFLMTHQEMVPLIRLETLSVTLEQ